MHCCSLLSEGNSVHLHTMGKGEVVEFVLGAALITQPQHALPLALASVGLAVFKRVRGRSGAADAPHKRAKASSSGKVSPCSDGSLMVPVCGNC